MKVRQPAGQLISSKNGVLMEAEELLTATHKLEESSMIRSLSEAIN